MANVNHHAATSHTPGQDDSAHVNFPANTKVGSPVTVEDKDIYPCGVCQAHCEAGIKCNSCQMWLHYHCTLLLIYFLIALTNSSKRYICQACTKNTYPNCGELADELEKCISEVHRVYQTLPQAPPDTQVTKQTQLTSHNHKHHKMFWIAHHKTLI